jgi:hypothetical protein
MYYRQDFPDLLFAPLRALGLRLGRQLHPAGRVAGQLRVVARLFERSLGALAEIA